MLPLLVFFVLFQTCARSIFVYEFLPFCIVNNGNNFRIPFYLVLFQCLCLIYEYAGIILNEKRPWLRHCCFCQCVPLRLHRIRIKNNVDFYYTFKVFGTVRFDNIEYLSSLA